MTGHKPDKQPLTMDAPASATTESFVSLAPPAAPRLGSSAPLATSTTFQTTVKAPTQPPSSQLLLSHGEVVAATPLGDIKSTVCRDLDGQIVFYRPSSLALHALLQVAHDAPHTAITTTPSPSPASPAPASSAAVSPALGVPHSASAADGPDARAEAKTTTIADKTSKKQQHDDENEDNEDDQNETMTIAKQHQPYVTLYAAESHAPQWSLLQQAWDAITLLSRQHRKQVTITTTTFAFEWDARAYQWHMLPPSSSSSNPENDGEAANKSKNNDDDDKGVVDLYCCTMDHQPIALLTHRASRLLFFTNTDNNPFRQQTTDPVQWHAFLTLSSLLLYDLITSQLHSLGGDPQALHWMIDKQRQATYDAVYPSPPPPLPTTRMSITPMPLTTASSSPTSPPPISSPFYQQQIAPQHHHFNHDSLAKLDHHDLDDQDDLSIHHRWSTNSMKSLELDPGCMQCWWGSHCWWSVFPCCMPGGWCDRLWIKWRGQLKHSIQQHRHQQHHHPHHPDHPHRSRMARRLQGWQEQQE
ncbi:hypothetical protein BC940DRAFT_289873 [Gongronella butleri]|nr:hypothetical protein BC940DRAFT_289873 [Gongronella butleri]